jgi:RNA polymerase sigma-54 factor
MAIVTKLHTKLLSRLVLTPWVQRWVMYNSLPTAELFDLLNQEMVDNPLLEEADEPEGDDSEVGHDPHGEDEDKDEDETLQGHGRSHLDEVLVAHTSLADHLKQQLWLRTDAGDLRDAAVAIIGNLDDDGYLDVSVDDVAAMGHWLRGDVERALRIVQSFDPSGVACRDLSESLNLQLRHVGLGRTLAAKIVNKHLSLVQEGWLANISDVTGAPLDEVRASVRIIRRLEPRPGRRYSATPWTVVIPDIYVQWTGGEYVAVFNEEGLPQLRISRAYRRLLEPGSNADDQTRAYIKERLRSAQMVIKSVMWCQAAIRKVATSIVQFEREFFDSGVSRLRPLVLRDVANDTGMHESTVGRLVANKYMCTPQGLLSMKFFFHGGIPSSYGAPVSVIAVKQQIRTLIETENWANPLSDRAIADILQREGISLPRQTIAKYRRSLSIPSLAERRRPISRIRHADTERPDHPVNP